MNLCEYDKCCKKAEARGLCSTHYKKWLENNRDKAYDWAINKGKKCSIEGCNNEAFANRLCAKHNARLRRHGTTDDPKRCENGIVANNRYTYASYSCMLGRTKYKSHKQYKDYGGRGIKVCDRWAAKGGFKNFLDDMGQRPDGYTLDRINVDGDYTPENCRWATKEEQSRNKRKK